MRPTRLGIAVAIVQLAGAAGLLIVGASEDGLFASIVMLLLLDRVVHRFKATKIEVKQRFRLWPYAAAVIMAGCLGLALSASGIDDWLLYSLVMAVSCLSLLQALAGTTASYGQAG